MPDYLNAARIKGSHAAIKSGMLAAEAAFDAVPRGGAARRAERYPEAFEQSWLYTELQQTRNFKNWFKKGLSSAADDRHRAVAAAQDGCGNPPWTLHRDKPTTPT
jgi:electron-transferring-flavoprotein dehydrogenase